MPDITFTRVEPGKYHFTLESQLDLSWCFETILETIKNV
jgi:hypothetical protein